MFYAVDQMPGAGKTTAAINYINSHPRDRFVYVTPYLSEVERIRIETDGRFKEPVNFTEFTPKFVDLVKLLRGRQDIVISHSLFSYFNDEIIKLIKDGGYSLIMDEVHPVVEHINDITSTDVSALLNTYVDIGNGGILKWKDNTEGTYRFADIKEACRNNCMALYGNRTLIRLFPVKVFEAFKDVYVLTYMFDAQPQSYYYNLYNIAWNKLWVKDFQFTTEPQKDYFDASLVNILEDEKLNKIGNGLHSLSKEWYKKASASDFKQLQNNMQNFFRNKNVLYKEETGHYVKSTSSKNLWTTFKDYQAKLAGKGYAKGFLSLNARATNNYRDRTVVAYMVNRFMDPTIKNFFAQRGVEVDGDAYALSELLQFVWRSGVRDGKHISVYIPSARMRILLKEWLDRCKN